MTDYTSGFYEQQREGSRSSARVVLPRVLEIVPARSVVDVGCGVGTWLAAARELGVEDVLGIDGEYVDRGQLAIDGTRFIAADLTRPLEVGRRFDLALCMEVAEHLPAESADVLVDSLTRLAPVVVFSAAIPGQGGTRHVNEQWPDYWAERFARAGYLCADVLRTRLWTDPGVEWWYAQNALVFASREAVVQNPRLGGASECPPMRLVHPANYMNKTAARKKKRTVSRRVREWMKRGGS